MLLHQILNIVHYKIGPLESNAIWEWFFHNTNTHVLIACKIYFKRRFIEARDMFSGGERGTDREMDEEKKEWNKEGKERETGSGGKKDQVTAGLMDGLQVCIEACA